MFRLRRYFITGLVVLLPIVVTIYLVIAIFNFFDNIMGKYINEYLTENLGFSLPGLGLLMSILIIFVFGFLAAHFLGRWFLPFIEKLLLSFPLSRQIYPSAKQVVNFLFSKEKMVFKKVVMIEYPRKGLWSVGFITNEGFKEVEKKTGEELVSVFIPSSPGPFTGFFILLPKKDAVFLDMSIDEGLKLVISGGILQPPSKSSL